MKLKVLILIDWFLPGNKAGGPVKSIYSMVKALQNEIDFYIVTMNTDIGSDKVYDIPVNQWTEYDGMKVFYFSKSFFSAKNLKQVIQQTAPDVIYINSFWSFKFSILPLMLRKMGMIKQSVVLAPRGMLEAGAMGIKSFKKNLFIFFSKLIGLYKNIIFHATSDEEKKSVKKYFSNADIIQVSNLSYVQSDFISVEKKQNHLKMFFLSRVSPVKNLDFAIKVLSLLPLREDMKIEYDIYGNNEDKEYFRYCKDLMKQLSDRVKVTYKGVLEFSDIPKVISHYHFLFLPTRNENFGHAIVETLSCGRPVLISDCTPWNDVNENKCGYALPLKENLFVEKLTEMLQMNNEFFQEMCRNAKCYISQKMNVEKIKSDYIKLFEYAGTIKH